MPKNMFLCIILKKFKNNYCTKILYIIRPPIIYLKENLKFKIYLKNIICIMPNIFVQSKSYNYIIFLI